MSITAQLRLTPCEAEKAVHKNRLAVGKFELLFYLKKTYKNN
jgi:hypothetical protein